MPARLRMFTALALAMTLWPTSPVHAKPDDPPRTVTVRVDPCVELMSIIFHLAGNPEYGRCRMPEYQAEVARHFEEFRDHEVVRMARRLRGEHGVSYDAVMSMAIHVKDIGSLAWRRPLEPRPEHLDSRWTQEDAEAFLDAARRFVEETSFATFLESQQPMYDEATTRLQQVLDDHAHLEWFDEFFGPQPKSTFHLILAPMNGPNSYGPRFRQADGTADFYSIMSVWEVDAQGKPRFKSSLVPTVIHEFCHSYANAVIDQHMSELEQAGDVIFPRVEDTMRRNAYGQWSTVLYESLVRASVIRYTARYSGSLQAWWAVRGDESKGFLWIGDFAKLLLRYEQDRETYKTLDDFAPEIITFFNDYAQSLTE